MKPINLNKARKEKARVTKRARADENAVTFGQSKAEKQSARENKERQIMTIDAHKLEK